MESVAFFSSRLEVEKDPCPLMDTPRMRERAPHTQTRHLCAHAHTYALLLTFPGHRPVPML